MKVKIFQIVVGCLCGIVLATLLAQAFSISALHSPIVKWAVEGREYKERLYSVVYLTDWVMLFVLYSLFVYLAVKVLKITSWPFIISLQAPQFVISYHYLVDHLSSGRGMQNYYWIIANSVLQMIGILLVFMIYVWLRNRGQLSNPIN